MVRAKPTSSLVMSQGHHCTAKGYGGILVSDYNAGIKRSRDCVPITRRDRCENRGLVAAVLRVNLVEVRVCVRPFA